MCARAHPILYKYACVCASYVSIHVVVVAMSKTRANKKQKLKQQRNLTEIYAERYVITRVNEQASERTNEREADRMEIENKNETRHSLKSECVCW